tara:strand:+ start:167 stop:403 length:237 start_codon:yes stop_codon:yes gene_type:complete
MGCSSCKEKKRATSRNSNRPTSHARVGPARARSLRQALDRLKTRKAVTEKRIQEIEQELHDLEGTNNIQSPFDEVLKD